MSDKTRKKNSLYHSSYWCNLQQISVIDMFTVDRIGAINRKLRIS